MCMYVHIQSQAVGDWETLKTASASGARVLIAKFGRTSGATPFPLSHHHPTLPGHLRLAVTGLLTSVYSKVGFQLTENWGIDVQYWPQQIELHR